MMWLDLAYKIITLETVQAVAAIGCRLDCIDGHRFALDVAYGLLINKYGQVIGVIVFEAEIFVAWCLGLLRATAREGAA